MILLLKSSPQATQLSEPLTKHLKGPTPLSSPNGDVLSIPIRVVALDLLQSHLSPSKDPELQDSVDIVEPEVSSTGRTPISGPSSRTHIKNVSNQDISPSIVL
ncbi:hypothetical protein GEMRC1_000750 [Eukaryota sp. GEM-RC1]